MVVLSGYPSPLYDEKLTGWERVERTVRTTDNGKATEALWLSPAVVANQRQMRLWELI
jgi:DNA adenine methylase